MAPQSLLLPGHRRLESFAFTLFNNFPLAVWLHRWRGMIFFWLSGLLAFFFFSICVFCMSVNNQFNGTRAQISYLTTFICSFWFILCVFTIHLQATSSLKQTNMQTQAEKRKEDIMQILQSDTLFLVSPDFVDVFPVGQWPLGLVLPVLVVLPEEQAPQGALHAPGPGAKGRCRLAPSTCHCHLRCWPAISHKLLLSLVRAATRCFSCPVNANKRPSF